MENQPALGECLRHIRRRNGWKLKDVSALTGVSMATLSKVENDQMSLTYDKILQICAGLNGPSALLGHRYPVGVSV